MITQTQLSTIKEDIMEDRILVDINPFALHHKINVVKNDNISTFSTTGTDLPNMICNLAKQYGIENIDLKGNESFLLKIKNDIVNSKFEYQTLTVNII